jgi:hypothetical protein
MARPSLRPKQAHHGLSGTLGVPHRYHHAPSAEEVAKLPRRFSFFCGRLTLKEKKGTIPTKKRNDPTA